MYEPVLLTTKQMASFVARGFLRLDAVVSDEINAAAIDELESILATWGTDQRPHAPATLETLDAIYPDPSGVGAMLRSPVVAGALHSLVGPDAVFDHDFVHRREPGDLSTQWLHADAIVDPSLAFDVQLFYMPHAVEPGAGGTRFVPGSHFRQVNEADVGRYQHVVGEEQFAGPAGSVLIFHHGLWHGAMPNDGERARLMYKIRLNPTRPQVRLWDTGDLDAMQNGADDHMFAKFRMDSVAATLRSTEPWYEQGTDRLELTHRARLWRYLSGDDGFDVDYYVSRIEAKEALADGLHANPTLRQQVLLLCLRTPELHASVIAWTFHDGSGARTELPGRSHGRPPYDSGVDTLEDGWRLIQMTPPPTPVPGHEHQVSFLKHEYVFERLVAAAD